jgi:hypothetical protein
MKKQGLVALLCFLLFISFFPISSAQSDYQIVQGFKEEHKEIEQQIKDAGSLEELNAVITRIKEFEGKYAEHKELLNKSLYPDKFDKSIQKLNAAFVLRQNDFATIDVLQTEVIELKSQIDFLNERNNELIAQIEDLKWQSKKDKKKLAEYENLIADLRASIKKRDRLVISMVDSLMPPIMREKAVLTTEDKKQIYSDAEREHVIDNVKVTLRDNIKFLEVTSLEPADIKEIKKQQEEFASTWKAIGPKLVEVYADKEEKTEELLIIDSLFTYWKQNALEENVWKSIREEFEKSDILLREFANGDEFTSAVVLYINDEIKSIGVKSKETSEKAYTNFVDSTYYLAVQPVWMSHLIESGMLSIENKNNIEGDIAKWKDALYPSNWWIYLLAVLVLLLAAVVIIIIIKKRKPREVVTEESKE